MRHSIYNYLLKEIACKTCRAEAALGEPIYSCKAGHTACAKCHLSAQTCRICRGAFRPNQQVLWRNVTQALEDEDDWIEKLSEVLECPVCYELLTTPSWTCAWGHATCRKCQPGLHACPVCREKKLVPLNADLYVILTILDCAVPCRNEPYGCRFKGTCLAVGRHERELCQRHKIHCEMEFCSWVGPDCALRQHVRSSHSDNYISVSCNPVYLLEGTWYLEHLGNSYWVNVNPPYHLRLRGTTRLSGPATAFTCGKEISIPSADTGRLRSLPSAICQHRLHLPVRLSILAAPSSGFKVAARTVFLTAFCANALYVFMSLARQSQ